MATDRQGMLCLWNYDVEHRNSNGKSEIGGRQAKVAMIAFKYTGWAKNRIVKFIRIDLSKTLVAKNR